MRAVKACIRDKRHRKWAHP